MRTADGTPKPGRRVRLPEYDRYRLRHPPRNTCRGSLSRSLPLKNSARGPVLGCPPSMASSSSTTAGSRWRVRRAWARRFTSFCPRASRGRGCGKAQRRNTKAKGGSETILLVEDEKSVRDLARTLLQRHGYHVLEAESGVQALAVWEKHAAEIDLLLTDIVMPEGVSGRDLAQKLRSSRPDLKVIFTSGYSPDKTGTEAELGEGLGFLQSPIP